MYEQAWRMGSHSRSEMDQSAFIENALAGVLPPSEQFPFPVKVNADCLSSTGSPAMTSVCAASLALRDAGVPVTDIIAGQTLIKTLLKPSISHF